MTKKLTSLILAKKWANINGLSGPQAFAFHHVFHFVEEGSEASDDFVFKGKSTLGLY